MFPKIQLLAVLILLSSCVTEVDFDQSDDIAIEPKYAVSLIHFTFNQSKFVGDVGNQALSISESSSTPLNTSSIANENLTRVDIQFKVSNSFNRTIVVVLELFDRFGNSTYVFKSITITPNTSNKIYTETIQGTDLANFVRSESAAMEVILMPSSDGSTIDPTIPKTLNVQMSGLLFLNFSN